jgi:hypothetical protein
MATTTDTNPNDLIGALYPSISLFHVLQSTPMVFSHQILYVKIS